MTIDFRNKINWRRVYRSPDSVDGEYQLLQIFESDRGRIVNSPAIRRLQQKTQVFPLERNASVRTRLTHSLEVQQVGRYIAKEVLSRLKQRQLLECYGLAELCAPFESVVEMACLMHDIGNPPFGHFGEAAINDWFGRWLCVQAVHDRKLPDQCQAAVLRLSSGGGDATSFDADPLDADPLDRLRAQMRQDLCHFEGNAQGIRLVHTLLHMNLTWAQVGCILKYTRPAWYMQPVPPSHSYLMKKPGFYLSEADYIARLREALQLKEYSRFPLTWIMEAADDISYCVADLEDAVEKRIFSVKQLVDYLREAWGAVKSGDVFSDVVECALQKSEVNLLQNNRLDEFFMYLRVNTLNNLVPYAASRFIDNLPMIFAGDFNHALLEDDSPQSQLLGVYKRVASKYVFSHQDVEQLELQGYQVINGLLGIYQPLLTLSTETFSQLVNENSIRQLPIVTRLYHKLSSRHKMAYSDALQTLNKENSDYPLWEYYYRCRLIQDYISGMTDLYARDEYRKLMAVE